MREQESAAGIMDLFCGKWVMEVLQIF